MKPKKNSAEKKPAPKKPSAKKPAATRPAARGKQPSALTARPVGLRRDTPVDTPAVLEAAALPGAVEADAAAQAALARLGRLETVEAAFEAWEELRAERRALLARLDEERKHLQEQGDFMVGAVKKARVLVEPGSAALAPVTGLDGFVTQADHALVEARRSLEARQAEVTERLGRGLDSVRAEVRTRLERALAHARPKLKLMLRTLAGGQRIVHLGRPSEEEAPMLMLAFTGRVPTRYGFLFDDSTDDPVRGPPSLYPDEGVEEAQVRPDAAALRERVRSGGEALPVKGIIPVLVPVEGAGERLVRFVERGPVMEAELADGAAWRNLLSTEEAEALAGWLLKLKLEGKVELELARG